jgi:uncharacterized protein GlcG (DUF336 family)
MIEMTFELAEKIAKAAHEKSKEFNRPMSVSIVDESGRMVYFSRADGAGFYTFDTSKAKAMAAASFKRSTMEIDDIKDQNPLLWFSIPSVIPGNALPSPGGRPIFNNGNCIGAIGVGGGLPDEDDACCEAGMASIKN